MAEGNGPVAYLTPWGREVDEARAATEAAVTERIARYLEGEALSLNGQVRDVSVLLRDYARTIRAGEAR